MRNGNRASEMAEQLQDPKTPDEATVRPQTRDSTLTDEELENIAGGGAPGTFRPPKSW